jgi:hypothetical protein
MLDGIHRIVAEVAAEQVRQSKVRPRGPVWLLLLGWHEARRQRPAHLLELGARGHLLGK